jgi:hypothetical protein
MSQVTTHGKGRPAASRSPRSAGRFATAAAGLAALLLAGCSSAPPAPTEISGYSIVCGGAAVPEAAAYTGPGPHPIAFFDNATDGAFDDGTLVDTSDSNDDVPNSWYTTNVDQIQLVACIGETPSSQSKDCGVYSYLGMPNSLDEDVTIQLLDYTISLYQAKTGTLIAQPITLLGNSNSSCPDSVDEVSNSTPYVQNTMLDAAQVQQALSKYVA